MSILIDLTGMRFGRLVVTSKSPGYVTCGALWNCLCDCGNTRIIPSQSLKRGRTKSCGCLNAELVSARCTLNLSGKTFGKLTVMHRVAQDRKRTAVRWVCLCSCGKTKCVDSDHLRLGLVRSCGCIPESKKVTIEEKKLRKALWASNQILLIADSYIRKVISRHHNFIDLKDVPKEFFEAKRSHIKLLRQLKEFK